MSDKTHRRSFLALAAGSVSVSLAGCTALFGASRPDGLEDVEADADQLPTPTIGAGSVEIEVYEDLACPGCQEFQADVFPELEAQVLDTDVAEYQHIDFPLPADEDRSVPYANAARAVQAATGTDTNPAGEFFEYKSAVMSADGPDDDDLAELAESEVDLDPDIVRDALDDGTYYPTLAADWDRADDNGVDRTPTVFVDGETVEDPLDAGEVLSMVEDAQ